MELSEILKKLEEAEGPSTDLAWDIAIALGAEQKHFDVGDGDAESWLEWPSGERVKDFTASLDAAVGLVEKVRGDQPGATTGLLHATTWQSCIGDLPIERVPLMLCARLVRSLIEDSRPSEQEKT